MEAGLNRAEERVLAAVKAAARARRARETSRVLWRVAPIVAAAILAAAIVVRWRSAPVAIPFALLAAAVLLGGVVAYVRRYSVRVSDHTAAAVDDDLELHGELRSAAWFAARGAAASGFPAGSRKRETGHGLSAGSRKLKTENSALSAGSRKLETGNSLEPWTGFHLEQAAARVEGIDLGRVYPPVRAGRARVATVILIAAALVVAVALPRRERLRATIDLPAERAAHKVLPMEVEGVPVDLPQDLEDLLLAIENGTMPPAGTANAALLDMLKTLQSLNDPKALAALARAMAANRPNADDAQKMKDLAERAKRDAEMTPASEVRDALDQLAKKLDDPESENDSAGFEKSNDTEQNGGVDLAGPSQTSRDATAIAGIGMIAVSKQEAAESNAPPGVGVGGSSSSPGGGGTMPDIAKALRHEVIEANEDDVSGDVHSDDRRKTERGSAATAFTGATAGRSDGSRAVAPPAVPETRRARIQTYFTRKQ